MNNLAGPQRKNGRGPGELEHRTGRRFEQYYTQLVADAVCCAPAEKLPEKIFRPDTNTQRHPQHLSARESRLDAIYEHIRRDASALERLGMRTAYCG
jgi:hypothetical protein